MHKPRRDGGGVHLHNDHGAHLHEVHGGAHSHEVHGGAHLHGDHGVHSHEEHGGAHLHGDHGGVHSHEEHGGAHLHSGHGTSLHEGHHGTHRHHQYKHADTDETLGYATDSSYADTATTTTPLPVVTAHLPAPAIHRDNAPKPIRKGVVGFDPSTALRNYEDSSRRGHSKQDSRKLEAEIDLSGEHGKRIFCKNLISSLYPLSFILNIIGRFPLSHRLNTRDMITFDFFSSCQSMKLFRFNITTALIIYALVSGIVNVMYTCIDYKQFRQIRPDDPNETVIHDTQIAYDRALIQRNAVPLIIVLTTLLQALISSILFTKKHDYLAHIFSFINKAAFTMHMDLAEKSKNFTVQSSLMLVILTSVFIMISCLKFSPSVIGTPSIFGSLMLRVFLEIGHDRVWLDPFHTDNKRILQIVKLVGGFFLITIFLAAVAPILLFIYKCRIIRNAFAFWNGRVYCVLLRGREFAQTEEARTTYNLLFKDHCILLDLLDSIDQMYSFTIESFFGLQVISLFFQMYFFFHVGSDTKIENVMPEINEKNFRPLHYVRPYDWCASLLMLYSTNLVLFAAGRAAAKVAEEAEAGMEVIRRKGLIGRRTDQELEFLYSMRFSFESYKKLEISGAGYLYYNKGFIALLILVSFFCFLLLCQFKPLLDVRADLDGNQSIGRFLRVLEGNSKYNSSWTNSQNNRLWKLAV